MKEIENENYSIQISDSSFYETSYICKQFNHMSSHLNELIHDVYISQLNEKEAQFAALQAQINPHFLYNALDNMNMMLIVRGQEDISNFVMQLSQLMRYNIDTTRKYVTLMEDLEQVEKYLFIQKIRFGERLSYTVTCDETIKQVKIIKICLLYTSLTQRAPRRSLQKPKLFWKKSVTCKTALTKKASFSLSFGCGTFRAA